MEPLNNGHSGNKTFVLCVEVVSSSEVEMYGQLMAGDKQFVLCREVVLLVECPVSGYTCGYIFNFSEMIYMYMFIYTITTAVEE